MLRKTKTFPYEDAKLPSYIVWKAICSALLYTVYEYYKSDERISKRLQNRKKPNANKMDQCCKVTKKPPTAIKEMEKKREREFTTFGTYIY